MTYMKESPCFLFIITNVGAIVCAKTHCSSLPFKIFHTKDIDLPLELPGFQGPFFRR